MSKSAEFDGVKFSEIRDIEPCYIHRMSRWKVLFFIALVLGAEFAVAHCLRMFLWAIITSI